MGKHGPDNHYSINEMLNDALAWANDNIIRLSADNSFSPYQMIKNQLTEFLEINDDQEKIAKFKEYCIELIEQDYDITDEEFNHPAIQQIVNNIHDVALSYLNMIENMESANKNKPESNDDKKETVPENQARRVRFTNWANVSMYNNPKHERLEKLTNMDPKRKFAKDKQGEVILPPMTVTGPRTTGTRGPSDQISFTEDDPLKDTKAKDIPDSEVEEPFVNSVTEQEIKLMEDYLEKIYGSDVAVNFTVIGDDTYEAQIFHEDGNIEKRIYSAQEIQQFQYEKNVSNMTSVTSANLQSAYKNEIAQIEAKTPLISMQYLKSLGASFSEVNTCNATLANIGKMFDLLKESKQLPVEKAQMAYAYLTVVQNSFPKDGHKHASALNVVCDLIKNVLVKDLGKENNLTNMNHEEIAFRAQQMGNLLNKTALVQDRPSHQKPTARG